MGSINRKYQNNKQVGSEQYVAPVRNNYSIQLNDKAVERKLRLLHRDTQYDGIAGQRLSYPAESNTIWTNDDQEPILLVMFVYLRLREIPDALIELKSCENQFMCEYGHDINAWFSNERKYVQAKYNKAGAYDPLAEIKRLDQGKAFLYSPSDITRMELLFTEWCTKWACGSYTMATWLVSKALLDTLCLTIGIELRDLAKKMSRQLDSIVGYFGDDPKLGWAWRALLTGEYKGAEKATRSLARSHVADKGFYRHWESNSAVWAFRWVEIRVEHKKETDCFRSENIEAYNISHGLDHWDMALLGHRFPRGAPLGTKQDRNQH